MKVQKLNKDSNLQEMSGSVTDKKIPLSIFINSGFSFHSLNIDKISFQSKSDFTRKVF